MRVCIAQTKSEKGDIERNIENHLKWIELAVAEASDLIIFPELSLTGYEPSLANALAIDQSDSRLDIFQKISDSNTITIGIGLPTRSDSGICISMVFFEPNKERRCYSKQMLHSDEKRYFISGTEQVVMSIKNNTVAPAICYESLQSEHAIKAKELGAEIYLASVAKSQRGLDKAFAHYPQIAQKFSMPVLMSNSVGFCDNFLSAGQSAVWNSDGRFLEKLDNHIEGLLIFQTETEQVEIYKSVVNS